MTDHNMPGKNTVKVGSIGGDGKVTVSAEFESHAAAREAASRLAKDQRQDASGLEKLIYMDEHFAPRLRSSAEILIRTLAVAFTVILGVVVAMSSGDAALLLFPDAPMPSWLLYVFGAATVPGGVWAAEELIKIMRDDIDDKAQKTRKIGYALAFVLAMSFDAYGVFVARTAHTTGSFQQFGDQQEQRKTLQGKIERAEYQLNILELPEVPSTTWASRVSEARGAPTRTGKPVQTMGELKDICQGQNYDYCLPNRSAFQRINFLEGKFAAAENAEKMGPILEANIADWTKERAALSSTSVASIDAGKTEEEAAKARTQRTMIVSGGQVVLFALLCLLLLDNRRKNIIARNIRVQKEVEDAQNG